MRKPKTAEEAYNSCLSEGYINDLKVINVDKARSLIENAETSISTAQIVMKAIGKQAKEWMGVYIGYYEALRMYTEAMLIFDKVDISNHQCLFAYLCLKHPELELDWDFFEKVRTKRNGINYYGQSTSYEDWKAVELQFNLYISTLKKEIRKIKKQYPTLS